MNADDGNGRDLIGEVMGVLSLVQKKVKKNEYFKRSTVRHLQGMLAVLVEDEGVSLYYRPYCLPRPVARSLKAQKRPHG